MTNREALTENLKMLQNLSDCIYKIRSDINHLIEPDDESFDKLNDLVDGVVYPKDVEDLFAKKLKDENGLFSSQDMKSIEFNSNSFCFHTVQMICPLPNKDALVTSVYEVYENAEVAVDYRTSEGNEVGLTTAALVDENVNLYSWGNPYDEDYTTKEIVSIDEIHEATKDEEMER